MAATAVRRRLRDLDDVDGSSFAAGEVPIWDGAKFVGGAAPPGPQGPAGPVGANGAAGPAGPPAALRGNRVMAMGDSITLGSFGVGSPYNFIQTAGGPNNYLLWASILSRGRILPLSPPVAATGGFTSTQIKNTHLPAVLTAQPDWCIVLAGTNDPRNAAGRAVLQANLDSIYTQLLAGGVEPVLASLPPISNVDNNGLTAINTWIERYAAENGLVFLDFFGLLVDPATVGHFRASVSYGGLVATPPNGDNVHPNDAGRRIMGQYVADTLGPRLPPNFPPLAVNNIYASADGANLFATNPLMLTDSGAPAGRPSNWTVDTGAPGAEAIAADPAIVGNYYTLSRGAADCKVYYATEPQITPGHRLFFGCRLKAAVKGVGGGARVRLCSRDQTVSYVAMQSIVEDIPAGSFFGAEFTMVAQGAGFSQNRLRFVIEPLGAAGAAISVGQLTLLNLTAAGIAP